MEVTDGLEAEVIRLEEIIRLHEVLQQRQFAALESMIEQFGGDTESVSAKPANAIPAADDSTAGGDDVL